MRFDDVYKRARPERPLHHAQLNYARRAPQAHSRKLFQDVMPVDPADVQRQIQQLHSSKTPKAASRLVTPIVPHKPQPSRVLMRPAPVQSHSLQLQQPEPVAALVVRTRRRVWRLPSHRVVLHGLAALVLVVGATMSWQQLRHNTAGQAQAAQASVARAVAATTTSSTNSAPNTATVTTDTLQSYQVAPDAARYIRIGKLGVWARVLQVGVTKDGALATPSNVFDTAWYKNSAKPGQPGAALIDGHVSSWTTNGVFYDIKKLVAGDDIEIERGDGKKFEFSVVKTVAYPKDSVDMKALMQPIVPGQPGLNLITCGGKYDSKQGEFTQRIAVYATLSN
ncbi:MAG TPA: class F sortase [Candidatus Microsaccharimonas sp.]|nr:class F sortase [Candidatus Microsaccharimonas sp.]